MKDSLFVFLSCFASLVIAIGIGVHFRLQEIFVLTTAIIIMLAVYKVLKKYTFGYCNAKINDTNVEFDFEENLRIINFDDLISFKAYYGTKATWLYLKNTTDNFKIYANNFCDRKGLDLFSKDLIIQLDKYKETVNPNIIHEGSSFATKGMLYFLIIATIIYLLAFFVENKEASLYIGIGGGYYLLIMWIGYYNKRNLKNK